MIAVAELSGSNHNVTSVTHTHTHTYTHIHIHTMLSSNRPETGAVATPPTLCSYVASFYNDDSYSLCKCVCVCVCAGKVTVFFLDFLN